MFVAVRILEVYGCAEIVGYIQRSNAANMALCILQYSSMIAALVLSLSGLKRVLALCGRVQWPILDYLELTKRWCWCASWS